ncbi:hypothetical protein [Sphingomonas sp. Leaf34]|uniref:hypothetical protein n=1 Tax=Sphingomonas sp. Leaf34 TaxID=1736216 RepID=UPI000B1BFFC3|nr:hypothetical protein [Sphingomonas sp. Leaf34]
MALFDGYVRERQPSPATIKRWRPVIANLAHHLGHNEAPRVSADDTVDWKEALMDHGISGRTIRELYLAAAKVVFPWAVENRKLATNPATGFIVCVPKRVRSRGPSFTAMEVRTILSGSLVMDQGRVSPEHALARRWIPWMCAYSGARVGEIAQMRGSDIVEIDGVWAMRITPEAGSRKNGHSGIVAAPTPTGAGSADDCPPSRGKPIIYDPERARGGLAGNAHHKKVGERMAG